MPMTNGGKHPGGRPPNKMKAAEAAEREKMAAEARERILARTIMKLTPEIIEAIEEGIQTGNYPVVVAERLGVSRRTYYSWMEHGESQFMEGQQTGIFSTERDPLGLRAELFLVCTQAEAIWEFDCVDEMMGRRQRGDYIKNHLMILERRVPAHWGRREVAATGPGRIEDFADKWAAQRAEMLENARAATAGEAAE